MQTLEHVVDDGAGWELSVFQTWDPGKLVPGRRPVLIVPGYGMNSFIFSWHPSGVSLEGFLAERGFEVWRVDLRAQGNSRRVGGSDQLRLEDLAADLGVAARFALERTETGADRVDVLGASLGGTIMLLQAVLDPAHRFGSLVAVGTPIRWVAIHPALRLAFASPALVGAIRIRGARRIAEIALRHIVRRTPWILSVYMNPEITDTSAVGELIKTVEDPNRHVNRQIAEWIRDRDLVVGGRRLGDALGEVTRPLLCVLANGDGIVPRATAEFVFHHVGSRDKELLEVGTNAISMAHADLFVSRPAHERVFAPVARWLADRDRVGEPPVGRGGAGQPPVGRGGAGEPPEGR